MDIETNTMKVDVVLMIEVIEEINMILTKIKKDIAVEEIITIKKKTLEFVIRVINMLIKIIEIKIDTAEEKMI